MAPLPIIVAEKISLPKAQASGKLRKFLREKLFILNSEYIIKERLGKPLYNVPKFFDLIEEQSPNLLLPRGFLSELTAFLDKEKIAYELTHRHPKFIARPYTSTITLTSTQETMVTQALATGSGIIMAPPGSGKTIMGLELIARSGLPALILTHRKEIMDQWVEQIQECLQIPKKKIGRYSSAYKKPGQQVTVGLLQSFARMEDLTSFKEQFGVIIIDECHHIPAKTFRAVVSQLSAPHIYGLTATPKRKHNDERLIYLYIGDIITTLSKSVPKEQPAGFTLKVYETALRLPFDWKTDQAELLAKVICYDTTRNLQMTQDIQQQVKQGQKLLVLSERKEHLAILELYLRESCETIVFTGDDSAKQRSEKLELIKNSEYEALLATGQLFGEGIHVPSIDCLVLAFPFAFEGKLVQYIGRLLHGSGEHTVIDYHDRYVTALDEQFKKRRRYYKKIQVA